MYSNRHHIPVQRIAILALTATAACTDASRAPTAPTGASAVSGPNAQTNGVQKPSKLDAISFSSLSINRRWNDPGDNGDLVGHDLQPTKEGVEQREHPNVVRRLWSHGNAARQETCWGHPHRVRGLQLRSIARRNLLNFGFRNTDEQWSRRAACAGRPYARWTVRGRADPKQGHSIAEAARQAQHGRGAVSPTVLTRAA